MEIERKLRIAGRAMARHGLAHAYGHCSVRLEAEACLVTPATPLGLVAPGDVCVPVPLLGELPDGVLGEVRMHRAIYRARKDVRAIIRCMPPNAMTLSSMGETPLARHGIGSYFYPRPPLWDDVQLVRSEEAAMGVANALGDARAIVLRGNGVVVVGGSIEEAACLVWFLEDSARLDLHCRPLDPSGVKALSAAAARARATFAGGIVERMWDYLIAGDAELS